MLSSPWTQKIKLKRMMGNQAATSTMDKSKHKTAVTLVGVEVTQIGPTVCVTHLCHFTPVLINCDVQLIIMYRMRQ
jgi:hypothetical protein